MSMRIWRAFKSAITGRFVSRKEAETHPDTTYAQTVRKDDDKARDGSGEE